MFNFWFQFDLFGITFDLQDEIILDVCELRFGTDSPKFNGSLLMFYKECSPYHDPNERHWNWDFLYLRQLFK